MEPTKRIVEELYADEVRRARAMPLEEKLLAGARLFDYACRITLAGIRSQHPDADDERARQMLCERVALAKRLEGRR